MDESTAIEVLHQCIKVPPDTKMANGASARANATVAADAIDTCPKCGAAAWVNIDCDLCTVCFRLLNEVSHD